MVAAALAAMLASASAAAAETAGSSGSSGPATTVEPDADGDGAGDLSGDGCPQDAARTICSADLTVADAGDMPVEAVERPARVRYVVRNAGPDRAEALDVVVSAAPGGRVLAVQSESSVVCRVDRCRLAPLASGATTEITADVTQSEPGELRVTATATSAAKDATPATATAWGRFTPQSVEPPFLPLPTPPCAQVVAGTREDDFLEGTAFGDTLRGLEGRDALRGGAANDCLEGGPSGDVLSGGPGDDRLSGGFGSDRLFGDDGNDVLKGGTRNDVLFGGPGDDQLLPGPGADRVSAGAGNDVVNARDGVRERIDCGPGSDRARVDRRDRVSGCEQVARP
jgi:hypothetical protein